MRSKRECLVGRTFGLWSVIDLAERDKNNIIRYLCECACENKTRKILYANVLRNGSSKSCGCLKIKINDDLSGKTFGDWLVVELSGTNKRGEDMWLCKCICNTERRVRCFDLKNGHSKGCGCNSGMKPKHGLSYSRIYNIYRGMIERCTNENSDSFIYYGERGIKVCDEWANKENGFINFNNWSMGNGYSDELSIDRINVNGNYEPENCRWATIIEQNNNTRRNRYIEIDGVSKTIAQWTREYNLKPRNIINIRLKLGWSGRDLIAPPKSRRQKQNINSDCQTSEDVLF